MNTTIKPDGKVHRHPHSGYVIQCATLLDGAPAVVTFRVHKGQGQYWATEATIRLVDGSGKDLFVSRPDGGRVVQNGFTKKQACDVFRQVRDGYVTRDGAVYPAKFTPKPVVAAAPVLRLEIDTSNAAFEDNPSEVASILRRLADAFEHGSPDGGKLRDSNGNTCGSYTFG